MLRIRAAQRYELCNAERAMQARARGRVFEMQRPLRVDACRRAERGERGFMEAAEDQLLLARIGVHVADREDARHARLVARGLDDELLAFECEAPIGDRPELRAQ